MQNRIGFVDALGALIESMSDHGTVTPKSKKRAPHCVGTLRRKWNERHAAWERFSSFCGPVGCLKGGPNKNVPDNSFLVLFDAF